MDLKKMIKVKRVWLVGMLATFFFACSSDEEELNVSNDFTISTQELIFDEQGGSKSFSVESKGEVEVTCAASWCKIEQMYIQKQKYTVSLEPNPHMDNRETTINVRSGMIGKSIVVRQSGTQGMQLIGENTYVVNVAGGDLDVKLKATGEYQVASNGYWIREKGKVASGANESVLTLAISPNTMPIDRKGVVTIVSGNLTPLKITITQNKKEYAKNASIAEGEAAEVARQIGLGWNLGNQFDSHYNGISEETLWGNPAVTQTTFDKLAAAGFTAVRIPITWMGQFGDGPAYTIKESWLGRIAEVVGYARNAGLKAVINMHHDGADSAWWLSIKDAAKNDAENERIKTIYTSLWSQIANKFKDYGSFLIFESMNEIHDGGWGWGDNRKDGGKQYRILNEWNQLFVDAVREVGGENLNRYLAVTGYCADPDLTMEHLTLPNDRVKNKLLVAVHYYSPYEYAINADFSEWGHTADAKNKPNYGNEEDLKKMFGKLKEKFVSKGIPVYIGEMGSVHRSTERAESFRKYYLEYVCKAARTYGMAPFYWDNGTTGSGKENFGLFNHGTGAFINNAEDVVYKMVEGYFTDDELYTLDVVYNNAPD